MQTIIIIILAIAIGIAIWSTTRARSVEQVREMDVDHVPGKGLRVTSANGAIGVHKVDRTNVAVTATVRARTKERLAATTVVAERDGAGVLSIGVQWPDGKRKGNEGCAFRVEIPDANGVRIESSNGSITVAGLGGDADLRTSNGSIEAIDQGGTVMLKTSNGRITATRPAGDVDAHTSNGRIEIIDAPTNVTANTSNGAISIRLADTSPGPVDARTSNGAISLTVGSAFAGELECQTSNGSCSAAGLDAQLVSQSKNNLRLKFGAGGQTSRVRTSNGSITVGRAGVE
jgi:hypothetical protein